MKASVQSKNQSRLRRQRRVRARVQGTAAKPRLSVFRSAKHIYAQVIDDAAGKTLAAADDTVVDKKEAAKLAKGESDRQAKVAVAYAVGKLVAEKAVKAGLSQVVFDRNGFAFTGRIAALAAGARDNGLKF
ncbi:MAG: 50S ribosomal protein L18 [Patescibacteria group bacterium]|jgi:large subunit ribosomal protein L18